MMHFIYLFIYLQKMTWWLLLGSLFLMMTTGFELKTKTVIVFLKKQKQKNNKLIVWKWFKKL